jgi:hypothetical protein
LRGEVDLAACAASGLQLEDPHIQARAASSAGMLLRCPGGRIGGLDKCDPGMTRLVLQVDVARDEHDGRVRMLAHDLETRCKKPVVLIRRVEPQQRVFEVGFHCRHTNGAAIALQRDAGVDVAATAVLLDPSNRTFRLLPHQLVSVPHLQLVEFAKQRGGKNNREARSIVEGPLFEVGVPNDCVCIDDEHGLARRRVVERIRNFDLRFERIECLLEHGLWRVFPGAFALVDDLVKSLSRLHRCLTRVVRRAPQEDLH